MISSSGEILARKSTPDEFLAAKDSVNSRQQLPFRIRLNHVSTCTTVVRHAAGLGESTISDEL